MIGLINGVLTAVLLIVFVAVWVWAWSSANKKNFETMAKLPLEDQPRENGESGHD